MSEDLGGSVARRAERRCDARGSRTSLGAKRSAKRTHRLRKWKAGTMKRRNFKTCKVQIESRAEEMRNADFGFGERRRAEARHPKPEGRARLTNYGPRITNHAIAQWPNKAIRSQAQGQDRDRPGSASCGGWVGAPVYTSVVVGILSHDQKMFHDACSERVHWNSCCGLIVPVFYITCLLYSVRVLYETRMRRKRRKHATEDTILALWQFEMIIDDFR